MDSATSTGPAAPRRGRGLRALEIGLFAAGAALLAYVAAVRLTGYFGSKSEIARFHREAPAAPAPALPPLPAPEAGLPDVPAAPAAPAVNAPPLTMPTITDFKLWSPERVREYRASMTERSDGPLAVIRIPNLDIEAAVLPDSSDWALNRGVGWIEGTALPGQPGNVGIAGHRDGFFRGLKDVAQGDAVQLELPGRVEQYRVASVTIVKPEDVAVLDPTPEPSIPLVTCYPFYFIGSAPERFIVKATRVASAH